MDRGEINEIQNGKIERQMKLKVHYLQNKKK